MQYTITLADGKKLTGLTKNGDNFVSAKKVDKSIFSGNLSEMVVSDGTVSTTYRNVVLVQQVQYSDGWYLSFRELSEQEVKDKNMYSKIEYIAMMANIDMEEV